MKKILILFIAAVCAVSCFDDGSGMGQKYKLVADFQYTGATFRSDSTFVNYKDTVGFGYDVLNFYHHLDYGMVRAEGGFTISRAGMPKSGVTDGLFNTYRAMIPADKSFDNIYVVYRQNPEETLMPEHDVTFSFIQYGTCTMVGCYVTNTVEVVNFIKKHFSKGDRLAIKAVGYLNGQKTGEAEMVLAEFSEKKDSLVTNWSAFDLKQLRSVEHVDFELVSTNPNIPEYFCIDELLASIIVSY
jgi:hypothetical protein